MDTIKKSSDFSLVASKGDKWFSDSFIIQILKREDRTEEDSRFGLVVSKKVGNAVMRNLVKRRFREIMRNSDLSSNKGLDIVLIGRKTTLGRSFVDLQSDLRWSLKRLGITKS